MYIIMTKMQVIIEIEYSRGPHADDFMARLNAFIAANQPPDVTTITRREQVEELEPYDDDDDSQPVDGNLIITHR